MTQRKVIIQLYCAGETNPESVIVFVGLSSCVDFLSIFYVLSILEKIYVIAYYSTELGIGVLNISLLIENDSKFPKKPFIQQRRASESDFSSQWNSTLKIRYLKCKWISKKICFIICLILLFISCYILTFYKVGTFSASCTHIHKTH